MDDVSTINGTSEDDSIVASGGAFILNGFKGDDYLEVDSASGLTGLYGNDGNDTLVSSVEGSGQIHMRGGLGDDHLIIILANEVGHQSHHVYGGQGADIFEFREIENANTPFVGRIDDFDASRDMIFIDGAPLDFSELPYDVRIVEYLGQQWLSLNDAGIFALEGARDGGQEQHFSPLPPGGIASLPSISYVDPVNFVPQALFPDGAVLNEMQRPGDTKDFDGTDQADWIYDYAVDRFDTSVVQISYADSHVHAGGGNDVVDAAKGDDTVCGGLGDDTLAGGLGADHLFGGPGSDVLFGGNEADQLVGNEGNDLIT